MRYLLICLALTGCTTVNVSMTTSENCTATIQTDRTVTTLPVDAQGNTIPLTGGLP